MGMYDDINCEMPLPEPKPSRNDFQTKDLGQSMERWTITADGRLIHHTVRYEDTPKDELPYPEAKPGTIQSLCGIIRSIPTGDVEEPYHGDLCFYTYDNKEGWFEYVARFTEGRCSRICLSDHRPPHPSPVPLVLGEA